MNTILSILCLRYFQFPFFVVSSFSYPTINLRKIQKYLVVNTHDTHDVHPSRDGTNLAPALHAAPPAKAAPERGRRQLEPGPLLNHEIDLAPHALQYSTAYRLKFASARPC